MLIFCHTYLNRFVYAICENQLVDGVSKGMYTLREHTVRSCVEPGKQLEQKIASIAVINTDYIRITTWILNTLHLQYWMCTKTKLSALCMSFQLRTMCKNLQKTCTSICQSEHTVYYYNYSTEVKTVLMGTRIRFYNNINLIEFMAKYKWQKSF